MRCGASGEPKTSVLAVFRSYRHFIRVKSASQRPKNFGQASENGNIPEPWTLLAQVSLKKGPKIADDFVRASGRSSTGAPHRRPGI
jgi:hypothetical protein